MKFEVFSGVSVEGVTNWWVQTRSEAGLTCPVGPFESARAAADSAVESALAACGEGEFVSVEVLAHPGA